MNLFYVRSNKSFAPVILVVIQFACIFYILLSEHYYPKSWLLSIYVSGIVLGLWAILAMRKAKLNISPDVVPGTQIISNGPYKWIRHPMYLAIFLTLLPLVIEYFSIQRFLIFFALLTNQIFKIKYEESELEKTFESYHAYQEKTWKLIPFIY